MLKFLSFTTVALHMLFFASQGNATIKYQIAEISSAIPKVHDIQPIAINDSGIVTGNFLKKNSDSCWGFIWDVKQGMSQLTSFGDVQVNGLNNLNQVIGSAGSLAYLWDPDHKIQYLNMNVAQALNNHGQIVGLCEEDEFIKEIKDEDGLSITISLGGNVILWDKASGIKQIDLSDILVDGLLAWPLDINDNGQILILAWFFDEKKMEMAFKTSYLWQNGQITRQFTPPSYVNKDDYTTIAFALNHAGDATGVLFGRDQEIRSRGVLWTNDGDVIEIGNEACPFLPVGINDERTVIGVAAGAGQESAYIWDDQNGLQNLNNLIDAGQHWHLATPIDINNLGQIVGLGLKDGKPAAFLLTPIE